MAEATLLQQVRSLLATPELPALGPGPRLGIDSEVSLTTKVTNILEDNKLAKANQELILALVLIWHDHLEASHRISQKVGNVEGSYVHGIMHRREPDYNNAKYWFQRVGTHCSFAALAERVAPLLSPGIPEDLANQLIPNGHWDAFAFVDWCRAVADRAAQDPVVTVLRSVQATEIDVLVEYLCR